MKPVPPLFGGDRHLRRLAIFVTLFYCVLLLTVIFVAGVSFYG